MQISDDVGLSELRDFDRRGEGGCALPVSLIYISFHKVVQSGLYILKPRAKKFGSVLDA